MPRVLGLIGIKVMHPSEIGAVWDQALSADRPVVIDAICDPDVPPLPPHITFEQAKGYMSTIFKGDPNLPASPNSRPSRWSPIF